jgi:glycosyltransferase involved in cell wall biosynthesis
MVGRIKITKKKLPVVLENQEDIKNVFIGTYPPVKCGIATFTKDLTTAINLLNPNSLSEIIAVTPRGENPNYPWEVSHRIEYDKKEDYIKAAQYINRERFDSVCIQHEYGIFGGSDGEYILNFAKHLEIPLTITLHTVLETPSPNQKKILKELSEIAKVMVVMSQTPKDRLIKLHQVEPGKIVVIPHGIPDLPFSSTEIWKSLFDVEGKFVIGSFGLLSPNKGYENLIKALPAVMKKHPEVICLLAGETHPREKEKFGEKYREDLIEQTEKFGIKEKVFFLNEYLSLQELTSVIQAMDIYVAPYTNPQQISSGALAYAIGCGRACVATPFAYAKEHLSDKRGILVPFNNSEKLSEALNFLIENPEEREKMAHSSYLLGRKMTWVKVADAYLDIFRFLRTVYGR